MARSDNWRINKSGLMAVEGAQILKALQKVAGASGLPSNFKVKFATKAHGSGVNFETREVTIGAGRLFNEAPIPADLFDVLVGLTLHEVGHQQINTDKVGEVLERATQSWDQHEASIFQHFCNIGEDIAIESKIRADPNLAEYDEILHKWATAQMCEAQPDKLLEVWLEYALGHKSTTVLNLPEHLVEPMQQLVALTGWLRKHTYNWSTRTRAYRNYWDAVKDAILNPPKPPEPEPDLQSQDETQACAGADGESESGAENTSTKPDPSAPAPEPAPEPPSDSEVESQSSQEPEQSIEAAGTSGEENSISEPDGDSSQTGSGKETEMERPLTPHPEEDSITDELAEAIEDAIETDSEDVTEQVAEEFGQQAGSMHPLRTVIRSRETKTPLIKPDPQLRKRLERIMTIRKRLQARTMHGEQYGKIDKRHLHRIGTDERVFSLRYKFPDGFPDTRILIDLSGSMSGREADEVLEAAGALQTLVNAEVWCYNYDDGQVNLVRMDEGRLVHRFKPDGQTPSGLAIVGVSLGMKKGGLIIHLTDGEHNSGQAPRGANWIVKGKGINLVNLIWGDSTRQYRYDGIDYQQLDGLAEFPEALYRILVEQVKLAKIGGR